MNIPKLSPPVFSYFRTWLRPISSNRPLSSIEFILTKFDYLEKHFLSLLGLQLWSIVNQNRNTHMVRKRRLLTFFWYERATHSFNCCLYCFGNWQRSCHKMWILKRVTLIELFDKKLKSSKFQNNIRTLLIKIDHVVHFANKIFLFRNGTL